jgi:alkylation response protein AidB-like acyl-CoA dehydrogenase
MDFTLNEDQRILRDQIIRFAQSELNQDIIERDRAGKFSHDLWLKCGDMGLQGLPVPEEYNGSGLDPLTTALALEAFSYGCKDGGLVFAVGAHLLACVVPIWQHGSKAQKEKYLPRLCNGRLIAVNAMTEAESGSDAFNMRTHAEASRNGYIITGTKTFSSNGPIADLAVVYASSPSSKGYAHGVSAFLVEKGVPGFKCGQTFEKMGLRTCPIGELVFDSVKVSGDAMLGEAGGGSVIFTESMNWERVCLAACHLGTMERLLEQATEYAKTRKSFGKPIGKYQAVSHRLADMKVGLEAARLLTYRAASRLGTARDIVLDASITKLFVSEILVQTAMDTVQILGGSGFMVEYGVERALRDATAATMYSGTSEMQRNNIARWMGL